MTTIQSNNNLISDIEEDIVLFEDQYRKYTTIINNIDIPLPETTSKAIEELTNSYERMNENKNIFITELPSKNSQTLKEDAILRYKKLIEFKSLITNVENLLDKYIKNIKITTGNNMILCWPFYSSKEKKACEKIFDKNLNWRYIKLSKITDELNKIDDGIIEFLQNEIQQKYTGVNIDQTIEEYKGLINSLLEKEGQIQIEFKLKNVNENTLNISEKILFNKNKLDIKEKSIKEYKLDYNTYNSMMEFLHKFEEEQK